MLQITTEFKTKVKAALLEQRGNFTGTDSVFARQFGINGSVFSRLKSGEMDGLLSDNQWVNVGRQLNVSLNNRKWNMARTEVYNMIEQDVIFCQNNAKSRICVDACGIGKTYAAKYLARTLKNCFYVDASQAPTKNLFIRLLAKTIGIDHTGKYNDVLQNTKYYLNLLPNPIVIVDEAGDLENPAFLALKGLWNATENECGWYLMGALGLKAKINKGIDNIKIGYSEIFSRYSDRYTAPVPVDRHEREAFYKKLIRDVLSVNMPDKSLLDHLVKRCLTPDHSGQISGLRRAESLLILSTAQ